MFTNNHAIIRLYTKEQTVSFASYKRTGTMVTLPMLRQTGSSISNFSWVGYPLLRIRHSNYQSHHPFRRTTGINCHGPPFWANKPKKMQLVNSAAFMSFHWQYITLEHKWGHTSRTNRSPNCFLREKTKLKCSQWEKHFRSQQNIAYKGGVIVKGYNAMSENSRQVCLFSDKVP